MSLKRIGAGFCGSVWAECSETISDTAKDWAIKREDGGPDRSLYNDYIMHRRILSALAGMNAPPSFYIPACHQYVQSDDSTWWTRNVLRFPSTVQIPCNVLITDRIRPFPAAVRNKIIEAYCPESLQALIKASEPDHDCLIRPYLGRRRRLERQSCFKAFSLRNYPLHIDQMEDMGLDITLVAHVMAEALAHLYWRARVDANDVEFVLAPPPTKDGAVGAIGQQIVDSPVLVRHAVWLLDFDCCRSMTTDEDGVAQAVSAFYRNDPYFPRPGGKLPNDRDVWEAFKHSFLNASRAILGRKSETCKLASRWVELVEARCST